jgi:hypothetical protein
LEDEPTSRIEDEPWGVVAALLASAAKNPDEDGSDLDGSWFLALPGPVKRGGGIASGVGASGCLLGSDGVAASLSTAIAKDPDEDELDIYGPLPLGLSGGIGASGRLTSTLFEVRLLGAQLENSRCCMIVKSSDILTSHKALGIFDQASGDSGRIFEAFE